MKSRKFLNFLCKSTRSQQNNLGMAQNLILPYGDDKNYEKNLLPDDFSQISHCIQQIPNNQFEYKSNESFQHQLLRIEQNTQQKTARIFFQLNRLYRTHTVSNPPHTHTHRCNFSSMRSREPRIITTSVADTRIYVMRKRWA